MDQSRALVPSKVMRVFRLSAIKRNSDVSLNCSLLILIISERKEFVHVTNVAARVYINLIITSKQASLETTRNAYASTTSFFSMKRNIIRNTRIPSHLHCLRELSENKTL